MEVAGPSHPAAGTPVSNPQGRKDAGKNERNSNGKETWKHPPLGGVKLFVQGRIVWL
jgi:hypothetical protein